MIIIKSAAELERMRISGRLAAQVRDEVAARVSPGVTTGELADFAGELIRKLGARSAFLGYRGYPGQICVSVNETVVHGIPGSRRVQLGDLVSIDVGVEYGGFIGDTATTVMVGVTDPDVVRLVTVTRESLGRGIAQAVAGNRVMDISRGIQETVELAGFSVVRQFVGHGIGRKMHEDPQIANFVKKGEGREKLKPGMTLAIEPMVNMGDGAVDVMSDGWTVLTRDRKPSAHFEHTIAVTDSGPEILTRGKES